MKGLLLTANANNKHNRKPNWTKWGVIVAAVGVVAGLFASHEPSTVTNIQGGVGNITQSIQGGIHNASQRINNFYETRTQVSTIVPAMSSPVAVVLPALETSDQSVNFGTAMPKTASKAPVTDDPYRHKATSSFDSFKNRQDRDDYALGVQHIALTDQRLGGFAVDQVIGEGRAVRQQAAEAAQQAVTRRTAQIAATANAPVSAPTPWQWPQTANTPSSVPAQESPAAPDPVNDMREVESKNGRPCKKTMTSDNSADHMDVWSCVGGYGSVTYYFLNGKLIERTQMM
jgi:hypothetical protein